MAKLRRNPISSVAKNVTGFSTPVFGLNWNPPKDKRQAVAALITYLEDKRVLYVPHDMEYECWAAESVLQVREELTRTLQAFPLDDDLSRPIKSMQAACRMFLDLMGPPMGRGRFFDDQNMWVAIGQLRGMFGAELAKLSLAYGVEVEGELAGIIPYQDDEE
ncbi:MAG: hypothetical protein KKF41_13905 [Actinobacteria bacterium]|nr:hypothetical protein [Actinomycetota bacterium]